jgi:predicted Zn-dependent peptidase
VISAAGNLDHDKLVRLVDKYFHFEKISGQKKPQLVKNIARAEEFIIPQPINQAHICTGGIGIPYNSDDRFALMVLNAYLGGGMSSRLFQRLREKRGLAYSIYSFIDFYSNIGLFGIYMGTDGSKLKMAQHLVQDELNKLVSKEISAGHLSRIKNQLKGNLVLGLESTSRRMTRLAKNELYFKEYVSIDSLIKNIDNVTTKDIIRLANDIIHPDNFITVILQPAA